MPSISTYTSLPQHEPPSYAPAANKRSASPLSADFVGASDGAPLVDPDEDFKYGTTVQACDLSIRMGFIRKIYSILLSQILATTTVGFVMMTNGMIKEWVQSNRWMMLTSVVGSFVSLGLLFWKRQSYPANFYLLGVFTLIEAYTIGTVTSFYDSRVVLQALVLTGGIFFALTLFTFQSKYDFVSWGSFLYLSLWALILVGFVAVFFEPGSTFELVYSIAGCFIFSGYILYDTSLIIKHLSVEEYIVGAVSLYLDVLNLFLSILRILNQTNRDN